MSKLIWIYFNFTWCCYRQKDVWELSWSSSKLSAFLCLRIINHPSQTALLCMQLLGSSCNVVTWQCSKAWGLGWLGLMLWWSCEPSLVQAGIMQAEWASALCVGCLTFPHSAWWGTGVGSAEQQVLGSCLLQIANFVSCHLKGTTFFFFFWK